MRTAHYIALLNRRDALHRRAAAISAEIAAAATVTSEPVFVEVLAYFSKAGTDSRTIAVQLIDALRSDSKVTVVRQTPESFDAGLDLYRRRPDKGYSLTDCMSMVICADYRIDEILTHDRHFEQEGFVVLL